MPKDINPNRRKALKAIGGIAGTTLAGCLGGGEDGQQTDQNGSDNTPDEPLRIGIVYPKTGLYSSLGPRVLDGAQMAINDHGKIFGMQPEVFTRDSQTDKNKGITAARELIQRNNVDVLIGAINTPINNAIANIADQNKVPFLYPAGGSVFMSGIKDNPHPFMFFANWNSIDHSRGLDYIADQYGSNFYFIASDYKYGHNSVDYAKEFLRNQVDNFKVVGESFFSQGASDYTSAISKAKSAETDVVHMTVPGVFTPAQKQAVQAGLTDTAHVHWAYASRPMGLATKEFAEGVTSFTHSPLNASRINEWANRFQEKYDYWPGWPATPTYNGVDMFLKGIEEAGTKNGVKIVRQLEGMKHEGSIFGPNTYFRAANHHLRYPAYIVQWTNSKKYDGGYWKSIKDIPIEVIKEASIPIDETANYPEMSL